MTDEELTELFGPKCPECGWRRGEHRRATQTGSLAECPMRAAGSGDAILE